MLLRLLVVLSVFGRALAILGCKAPHVDRSGFDAKFYNYPYRKGKPFEEQINFYEGGYRKYGHIGSRYALTKTNFNKDKAFFGSKTGSIYGFKTKVTNFSLVLTGWFYAKATGKYNIIINSKDASAFSFGVESGCYGSGDADEVISKFFYRQIYPNSILHSFDLKRGYFYPIKIIMTTQTYGTMLDVGYQTPTGAVIADIAHNIFQVSKFPTQDLTLPKKMRPAPPEPVPQPLEPVPAPPKPAPIPKITVTTEVVGQPGDGTKHHVNAFGVISPNGPGSDLMGISLASANHTLEGLESTKVSGAKKSSKQGKKKPEKKAPPCDPKVQKCPLSVASKPTPEVTSKKAEKTTEKQSKEIKKNESLTPDKKKEELKSAENIASTKENRTLRPGEAIKSPNPDTLLRSIAKGSQGSTDTEELIASSRERETARSSDFERSQSSTDFRRERSGTNTQRSEGSTNSGRVQSSTNLGSSGSAIIQSKTTDPPSKAKVTKTFRKGERTHDPQSTRKTITKGHQSLGVGLSKETQSNGKVTRTTRTKYALKAETATTSAESQATQPTGSQLGRPLRPSATGVNAIQSANPSKNEKLSGNVKPHETKENHSKQQSPAKAKECNPNSPDSRECELMLMYGSHKSQMLSGSSSTDFTRSGNIATIPPLLLAKPAGGKGRPQNPARPLQRTLGNMSIPKMGKPAPIGSTHKSQKTTIKSSEHRKTESSSSKASLYNNETGSSGKIASSRKTPGKSDQSQSYKKASNIHGPGTPIHKSSQDIQKSPPAGNNNKHKPHEEKNYGKGKHNANDFYGSELRGNSANSKAGTKDTSASIDMPNSFSKGPTNLGSHKSSLSGFIPELDNKPIGGGGKDIGGASSHESKSSGKGHLGFDKGNSQSDREVNRSPGNSAKGSMLGYDKLESSRPASLITSSPRPSIFEGAASSASLSTEWLILSVAFVFIIWS